METNFELVMQLTKVSVCITVFNEGDNIEKLLVSLAKQTRKPDEIVIVDGGSTDKTVQQIRKFQRNNRKIVIKLLIKKCGIAEGRNLSINFAKNAVIALTDAGCVPKKDWLVNLTRAFKDGSVGVVAGFYKMFANTPLQAAVNIYHGIPPERFDENSFLPSARSVAFRKKIWETVGGFNENLTAGGEDTEFFYKATRTKTKIVREKEALVDWVETGKLTFADSLMKLKNYANGDARAGIWWHPVQRMASHNIKILSIFVRYIFGFLLLVLSFKFKIFGVIFILSVLAYAVWSIWKWRDVIKNWSVRIWLPVVQITSDLAVMRGFIAGLIA